jgi:hypothetical protein
MESNITLYVIFNQALQVEVVQVLASGCFTRNVDRQKPQFFCSVQVKKTLLWFEGQFLDDLCILAMQVPGMHTNRTKLFIFPYYWSLLTPWEICIQTTASNKYIIYIKKQTLASFVVVPRVLLGDEYSDLSRT